MDPKPTKRQPVPAGGQPTPDTIAAADAAPVTPANAAPTDAGNAAGAAPADAGEPAAPTDDSSTDDGGPVEARVLVAFDGYDVNDVFEASADEVERQKLAGTVDPHPDAVAFAKSLAEEA